MGNLNGAIYSYSLSFISYFLAWDSCHADLATVRVSRRDRRYAAFSPGGGTDPCDPANAERSAPRIGDNAWRAIGRAQPIQSPAHTNWKGNRDASAADQPPRVVAVKF